MQTWIGDPPLSTPITEGKDSSPFGMKWAAWLGLLAVRLKSIFRAFIPGLDTMAYANTITLDVTLGRVHETTTVNATGNATINANSAGASGQELFIIVNNDATSGKTITFGTNFKPSGTLVGTASKTAVVHFVSDASHWWEVKRTTGL